MIEQKPRQRRQQRTQQAILDAARQIVTQLGAGQLSMRAIAEKIDYSPAGLYEYFDSKEAIIQALCTESHQRLRDQLLQVDPNLPPAKHLEALGLAYIRFALANPETYLLMFTNPPSPADLGPMLGESSSYPVLLDSIRRGLKRGDFKARAGYGLNEIAYSAWALVHGMAMLRLTYLVGFPLDLDAVDRETLHTFGRGLQLAGE